jgi:4'-phosphopantetheinyl transferase
LPLVGPASRAVKVSHLLTDDEEARLDRMASAPRRDRARAAWGARRIILARLLERDPRDIAIVRHSRAAPPVDEPDHSLHVSLSHSGDWMLFAVSRAHRVGVDIERIDPATDVVRLARRFFPSNEADALSSLPSSERHEAFFRAWTRKEAILKGVGGGVPSRLRSVPSGITRAQDTVPMAGTVWTLCEPAVPELYAATLAVDGRAVPMTLHDTIESIALIEQIP